MKPILFMFIALSAADVMAIPPPECKTDPYYEISKIVSSQAYLGTRKDQRIVIPQFNILMNPSSINYNNRTLTETYPNGCKLIAFLTKSNLSTLPRPVFGAPCQFEVTAHIECE